MSHYYSQSPSHSLWGLPYSQQNLLWADNNNCRWYYAEFQVVAIMAISVTNFVPVRLHAWAEEIRRRNADQPSLPTGWHVYVCAGASLRIIVTSIAGSVVHCIGVVDVSAELLVVCASLSGSSPGEILCCSCIAVYIASESSTSVPCSHRVCLFTGWTSVLSVPSSVRFHRRSVTGAVCCLFTSRLVGSTLTVWNLCAAELLWLLEMELIVLLVLVLLCVFAEFTIECWPDRWQRWLVRMYKISLFQFWCRFTARAHSYFCQSSHSHMYGFLGSIHVCTLSFR